MRIKLILFVIVVFLLLCAFTPAIRYDPYSFYQNADQIASIEILETDPRYNGLAVPAKVVKPLSSKEFQPLLEAFCAAGKGYDVGALAYIGKYAVRIQYQDGSKELLFQNNTVYVTAAGEIEFTGYYTSPEDFNAFLHQFYDPAVDSPG